MDPIQTFLNELQKRIDAVSSQVIDFESEKNSILSIDNILFKYSLDKDNISGEDLLILSDEDLKEILKIKYKDEELDNILELFKINASVVKMYLELKNKYGDIDNASQFREASNFINRIAREVSSDLSRFIERNKAYIEATKKSVEIPKKYLEIFSGNKLNEPIFDLDEFNNLVDNIGLSIEERAAIKKFVGQSNYTIVTKTKSKEEEQLLAKYYAVIAMKKRKFKDIYNQIKKKEFTLSEAEAKLDLISTELVLEKKQVRQAMTCLLLEKTIKEYDDTLTDGKIEEKIRAEYLLSLNSELEDIMAFSRKRDAVVEEIKPDQKEDVKKEAETINPDTEIITTAENILHAESALIASIDASKLNAYLAQNIDNNSKEAINYKIVSILMEMLQALNQFKEIIKMYEENDENYKYNHDQSLGNLRKYIEAYNTLKTSLETEVKGDDIIKGYFKILYLTNENGEALITKDLASSTKKVAEDIHKIINEKLPDGELLDSQKLNLDNKSVAVYSITLNKANVCYIRLASNMILVLCAINKNEKVEEKINELILNSKAKLNEIIIKVQKEEDALILYDEQLPIRNEIIKMQGSQK